MPPVRQILRRLLNFWNTDRSLTALLILLAVFLFILTPLVSSANIGSELSIAFFALLTLTGVAAVARRPLIVALVATFAAASVVLDALAHVGGGETIRVANLLMRVTFVMLLGTIVTLQVFRPGDFTHHRVQGAIAVYLLAALAWAHLYEIVALLDPSSFRIAASISAPSTVGHFRYFSFETLTTLGYGDILPVSPIARSLASCEALFGQLYPAVMIARLVSLELSEKTTGRARDK